MLSYAILLGASAGRIAIGLNVIGHLFTKGVGASAEHALVVGVVLQIGTLEAVNETIFHYI